MKRIKYFNAYLLIVFLYLLGIKSFAQFTFVHITDTHVCDNTFMGNTGNYDMNGDNFQCTLDHINALNPKPAFVVISGDISNIGMIGSSDGMYGSLTRHLFPTHVNNPTPGVYFIDAARTIPIYFIVGNHEYYQSIVPPIIKDSPQYYSENLAPDADYSVVVNNALMIFLRTDGDRPIIQDPHLGSGVEGKGITNAQCTWLRNTLSTAGTNRKIIVMHHPVVNAEGTNIDGSSAGAPVDIEDGSFLYNRETFMNICDSNNVDIICAGHVHQNVVLNRAGAVVPNNWTNGTRYMQTAAEYQGAYRIITVNSSSVSIGNPMRADATPASASAIIGLTTVSQGQSSVIYTVPIISDASYYVWTLPSGATGSSTTNSISVDYGASAVSGNITVKGYNVCGGSYGGISSLAITVINTPPPSNDNCIDAINISSLPYISPVRNNICATNDNINPTSNCGEHSANVWFRVTGTGALMEANTCDAATNFNTEIHIYQGFCGSLTEVVCNDDDAGCGNGRSKVNWCSTFDAEYYISVGNYNSTSTFGNFVLNVNNVAPTGISASPLIIFSGQASTLSVIGGSLVAGTSWKWYIGNCGDTSVPIQPTPPGDSYTTPGLTTSTTYYVRIEGCDIPSACASQVIELSSTPACDFIYVSDNGNDANSGSSNSPYKTINVAINSAIANSINHIKVSNGNYIETSILNIPAKTVIEGGYNVINGIWTKSSNSNTNIICSGTETIDNNIAHVMGFKSDSSSNWKLIDLNITTSNSIWQTVSGRGKSNYGIWINNSYNYEIIRCNITSGSPSSGLNGINGLIGHTGANGAQDGVPACADGARSGGVAGSGNSNMWGNNGADGGPGGNSASAGGAASSGFVGDNASLGGKLGGSLGIAATNGGGTCGTYSTGGNAGNGGSWTTTIVSTSGIDGGLANNSESFVDYYIPSGQGSQGGHGYPGAGGGGGGGTRGQYGGYVFPTTSCLANGGNSGSGGGQGGGGGEGGTGGWGSGGTFGIYQTSLANGTITDTKINSGQAVLGGLGGDGGYGGIGGMGPEGRDDCNEQRGTAGKGGNGGNGAKGGAGETGATGATAQVYYVGSGVNNNFIADIPNFQEINITYNNNMKICKNSVLTINNISGNGNWTLPQNFEYVKYNLSDSTSQYSASSFPADIYPIDNDNGFYDLQSDAQIFPRYLDLESDDRSLPIIQVTDSIDVQTDSIFVGASIKANANTITFGNIIDNRWEIFSGTNAPNKSSFPDNTAIFYSNTINPTFGPFSVAGTYTIRYQVQESCCGWSIPVFSKIIVKPTPIDYTGIDDILANNNVYYYNNTIYVSSNDISTTNILVYNLLGQEVLKTQIEGKTINLINANELEKGYYFIRIISKNYSISKKVYID